jgi:hypothetical protein
VTPQLTANRSRRDEQFVVGQEVLLSSQNITWPAGITKKLVPRYLGPFKVIAVLGPVKYILDLPSTMRIHNLSYITGVHTSLLKAWVQSDSSVFPAARDPEYEHPPVDVEDDQNSRMYCCWTSYEGSAWPSECLVQNQMGWVQSCSQQVEAL